MTSWRYDDFSFGTSDGLRLPLRRCTAKEGGKRVPVLMLHGASAASNTFEVPKEESLVDYLLASTHFEPWLLDWRGSRRVTETYLECSNEALEGRSRLQTLESAAGATPEERRRAFDDYNEVRRAANRQRELFDFDRVAIIDIPEALRRIEDEIGERPTHVIAHCMGAACLSIAIAIGFLEHKRPLTHVVLSTIGLFYEVAVDGRLKASDRVLERLLSREEVYFVDPTCKPRMANSESEWKSHGNLRTAWPRELEEIYQAWPPWLRPHREQTEKVSARANAHIRDMCNRLSFMYGEPYYEPALHPDIHASPELLPELFGAIPLRMYVHAAQCVRRRWAGPFEAGAEKGEDDLSYVDDSARCRFDATHVTLITGAMNRLWHRDSVDRMYEWLKRDEGRGSGRYRKIIFKHNGHQDLLWGKNSWSDVFPAIVQGLSV